MKKIIIYEAYDEDEIKKGDYDYIVEGLTEKVNEFPSIMEDERKIFGNDEMYEGNAFYQLELLPNGKVQMNYYDTEGIEDFGDIDYEHPYDTDETEYKWMVIDKEDK